MRNKIMFSLLLCAALVQIGCLGGSGSTVRYYTVNPVEALPATAAERQLAIDILNVHVPDYLERSHIVTRDGNNSLQFSDTNQWAENLRKNLMRTMVRNLSAMLGTSAISTPLSRSSARPDYLLEIHIDQFEQDSNARVRLAARWQLIRAGDDRPLGVHSVDLQGGTEVPEHNYDRMTGDMRELYGQLSRKIADDILAAQQTQGQ